MTKYRIYDLTKTTSFGELMWLFLTKVITSLISPLLLMINTPNIQKKAKRKFGYLKQSGDLRVAPLPSYLLNVPSGYNFLCVSDLTYQAIFEDCHYL